MELIEAAETRQRRGRRAREIASRQIVGTRSQVGAGEFLRLHFLLQQMRGFLFQTNIHRSVADQVAVAARAAKRLK